MSTSVFDYGLSRIKHSQIAAMRCIAAMVRHMEIHQLRYFVTVADLANFTRAAEQCLVAQPSLSQQIIKLEKELGGALLDRTGRQVRLTERGRKFYDRAVGILTAVDSAKHELIDEHDVGQVIIGAIPTIAPYLLPALLKSFLKKYPKAEVTLHENFTEPTLKALREGVLDAAIVALPIDDAQFEVEPLFSEELLLALPPDHRLARKRKLQLVDIADEPFVLLSEAHCLGQQIVSFCRHQSCLPTISCHSAQLLTVQQLVALGHGVSLIPQLAVDADHQGDCVYRSLSGPKPQRTLALVWRKHRHQSRLVHAFFDVVRRDAQARG